MFNITKNAANEMQEKYDKDLMGKIALSLYESKAQPRHALLGYPFCNMAAHMKALPTREGI